MALDKYQVSSICVLYIRIQFILFENLFKARQRRLAVGMVTDFVSFIYNLKTLFWAACG